MNALRYSLLILHFIGLAAILGPFLDQLRADAKRITTTMVWGARAQLVTGLALAGLAYSGDDAAPPHAKIAIKLLVALAVVGISEATHKKAAPAVATWWLVGGLTVVNIIVAVAWH
jgi:hypothetical protein